VILALTLLAGATGAVTRFLLDAWIKGRWRSPLPWGTMLSVVSAEADAVGTAAASNVAAATMARRESTCDPSPGFARQTTSADAWDIGEGS
jgi:fluoride ion exporter CrcB/FEX